ncbi:MAG: hypothetical protein WCJ30_15000, partial [Deltaproteobacteria bacterium]
VLAGPTVTVDRSVATDTRTPPGAPTGPYPVDGLVTLDPNVKLMVDTVPRATQYQFAVETWTGARWAAYYTWTTVNPFLRVSLPAAAAVHRFRVRANSAYGWGAWSATAQFDTGRVTGTRPPPGAPSSTPDAGTSTPDAGVPDTGTATPDAGTPDTGTPDAGTPPSADAGTTATGNVPTGLSPGAPGAIERGPTVTLSWNPVPGATSYDVSLENGTSGGAWVPYFTYTGPNASRTFDPQVLHTSFRWRVRSLVAGVRSDWSAFAMFRMN